MTKRATLPLMLLLGLQVLDVLVHVAADQFEPLRLTASAMMSLGAVGAFLTPAQSRTAAPLSALGYLALNVLFVVENGIVNPETDQLRIPLMVFVAGTLALVAWLVASLNGAQDAQDH